MEFDDMELLFLRRVVMFRLDSLTRTLEKNRRFFRDTDDDILYQAKVGSLEVEVECLERIKEQINLRIAEIELKKSI